MVGSSHPHQSKRPHQGPGTSAVFALTTIAQTAHPSQAVLALIVVAIVTVGVFAQRR
ncbi:hypothetical protein [Paraburkholderia sp. J10-1]|uniref:hypothetical protein n=1 Tax=Paraburkholderia sp. J10-1 TaxID=2805430 RepID=UPI002AB799A1|nr:hypothetical protein [Paraburkholderia sp. J10-1]